MSDKKSYKERNGTTRVGDALRWLTENGKKVAPGILELASNITGVQALDNLAKKISDDKELSEQDKIMLNAQIEMDRQEMTDITNRWKSDMTSDSWLSKNIRPLTLAFLTLTMFVFILLDSSIAKFVVKDSWVNLLESLLIAVYLAYFGSRGVEKFKKISKE